MVDVPLKDNVVFKLSAIAELRGSLKTKVTENERGFKMLHKYKYILGLQFQLSYK